METIYFKYELISENHYSRYSEYKAKSKFIIPIWKQFENLENNLEIKENNDSGFIDLMSNLPDTEIENLLNFHFAEFAGEKQLFLFHTESLINEDKYEYIVEQNLTKKMIVSHWIKEKKQKLNEPETNPKHKKIEFIQKTQSNKREIQTPLFIDLFNDADYHVDLLKKLQKDNIITYNDKIEEYVWEKTDILLSEFYNRLKTKLQLKPKIKSQDCARSLCEFFNVEYSGTIRKYFQPKQLEINETKFTSKFSFIVHYSNSKNGIP